MRKQIRVTNINFLQYILLHHQEKRLWEVIKQSPKGKCLNLVSNSLIILLQGSILVFLKSSAGQVCLEIYFSWLVFTCSNGLIYREVIILNVGVL